MSNATRHGILSNLPVIDGSETREGWLAHRQAFWDDLKPQGAAQEAVVEQIAFTFWRKARLLRVEAAAALRMRKRRLIMVGLPHHPDHALWGLTAKGAEEYLQLLDFTLDWLAAARAITRDGLGAVADAEDDESVVPAELWRCLCKRLQELKCLEDADGDVWRIVAHLAPKAQPDGSFATIDLLLELEHVAIVASLPMTQLLDDLSAALRLVAYDISRDQRSHAEDLEHLQGTSQLPPEEELPLLIRYDAHLGRELARLFKTFHDLQRHASSRTSSERPDPDAGLRAVAEEEVRSLTTRTRTTSAPTSTRTLDANPALHTGGTPSAPARTVEAASPNLAPEGKASRLQPLPIHSPVGGPIAVSQMSMATDVAHTPTPRRTDRSRPAKGSLLRRFAGAQTDDARHEPDASWVLPAPPHRALTLHPMLSA